MTLEEILQAIKKHDDAIVLVTLTGNRTIQCILKDAHPGNPQAPQGYKESYFNVLKIDSDLTDAKYNCNEVISIVRYETEEYKHVR